MDYRRHMLQHSRPSSVLHSNIQRFCHTCISDVRHMVRVSSQIVGPHIASYMIQPQDSNRQTRYFPPLYRLVCSHPQEKLQRIWRGLTVENHKNEMFPEIHKYHYYVFIESTCENSWSKCHQEVYLYRCFWQKTITNSKHKKLIKELKNYCTLLACVTLKSDGINNYLELYFF